MLFPSTAAKIEPPPVDSMAAADDRRWFERNPRRTHRLRAPGVEESDWPGRGPTGATRFIVVRQMEPGVRVRFPVWVHPLTPNTEAVAHAAFDLAMDAAHGDGFAPPGVFARRVAALSMAGSA